MNVAEVPIRELENIDLPALARVHTAAFPESSLTRLGLKVLERYYDWLLNGPHDTVHVGAILDDRLASFCFAGVFLGAMGGFLQKYRTYLAVHVLTHPWLITNPIIRDRIQDAWRAFRCKKRKPGMASAMPDAEGRPRRYALLVIATHPSAQGYGLGTALMEAVEQHARSRGFKEMSLTVHLKNHQARSFYEKLGWETIRTNAQDAFLRKRVDAG